MTPFMRLVMQVLRGIGSAVAWVAISILVVCAMIVLATLGSLVGAAFVGLIVLLVVWMGIEEIANWKNNRNP